MKVLVISNAAAARARRSVAGLREALPAPAVEHRVTDHPDELAALLGHDRWQSTDVLVINGGDGSVQHALTPLLRHCPHGRLPRVACLPGGTTNMTAFDLNRHRRFDECLRTLRGILDSADAAAVPRRVVGVESRADPGAPRYGMFFGIGTIVQGIEYFQARIRHRSGGHELGAGAALARTLWGIARRQPPFSEPLAVRIELPGGATAPTVGASASTVEESASTVGATSRSRSFRQNIRDQEVAPTHAPTQEGALTTTVSVRLLLATTLERLFLGIRPYWGTGPGALKTTLVESRAPGFVRRMPRLLRGRPDAAMTSEHGYHSTHRDNLTLGFTGSYTLDGELFGVVDDTIDVHASEPVKFLRL